MKTQEILNQEYKNEKGKEIIQKALRRIKPFAKYPIDEDIEFEKLEKAILIYCKKLNVEYSIFYLLCSDRMHGYVHKDHKVIKGVYGKSTYEIYAKLAIYLYSYSLGLEKQKK